MSQVTLSSTPRVILVDIEGTTTSISFVKDVLFTYAAERLERYLNEHWSTEQLQQDVDLLRNEAIADQANGVNEIPLILVADQNSDDIKRSVVQNVRWQMSIDRKSRSLKQLQGHIWERGYADKDLLTHVYDDVPPAFEAWTNQFHIHVYVYSSGSVEAQKLLFGRTVHGDLLKFITGHFDTKVGAKINADSYRTILNELNVPAQNVMFLTDVYKEAEAAKEAGVQSIILLRPGNAPIEADNLNRFETVHSFLDIHFADRS